MTTYLTRDGDMADDIAFKQYGTTDGGVVEKLLAANPGLADYGPRLPGGITITLPVIDVVKKTDGVTLWS